MTSRFDSATARQTPQSARAAYPAQGERTGEASLAPVRFAQLREVASLQQRSFSPRLAYGLLTLLYLRLHPRSAFLVATEGNRVVGCAIGDWDGRQSRVVNICVDPADRRRGIGSRLLRKLEDHLPDGDLVLMAQLENEAARRLYEKEGYQEIGIIRNYYGRGKDGVWMEKRRAGPNASTGSGGSRSS